MGEFVIGTTDFGVDPDSAIFDLAPEGADAAFLTVEFDGMQEKLAQAKEQGGENYSWASYPPSFYLRDFPVPLPGTSRSVTIRLDRNAYQQYEVALYMMEHNTVEGVITLTGDRQIEITGQVDLIGKPTPFRIRWIKPVE